MFIFLALLVIPYYHLFAWIEDRRLLHRQFWNVLKIEEHAPDVKGRHLYIEL